MCLPLAHYYYFKFSSNYFTASLFWLFFFFYNWYIKASQYPAPATTVFSAPYHAPSSTSPDPTTHNTILQHRSVPSTIRAVLPVPGTPLSRRDSTTPDISFHSFCTITSQTIVLLLFYYSSLPFSLFAFSQACHSEPSYAVALLGKLWILSLFSGLDNAKSSSFFPDLPSPACFARRAIPVPQFQPGRTTYSRSDPVVWVTLLFFITGHTKIKFE